MKTPLYAALDLHSRYSVLGSMDYDGNTQPKVRFPTSALLLRKNIEALRQKKRPIYLTMEAMATILLGYQSLLLFVFAKFMAIETGLHPPGTRFWFLQKRSALEGCIVAGITLVLTGLALGFVAAYQWRLARFGSLTPSLTIRVVASSVLFLLLGGQTLLAGFYFGLANLAGERRGTDFRFDCGS